ncbi:aminoimidazole riboside kinase [Virgibacillus sp. C22-A2]|uniref:Aminoimidazole riboside kinase n=1 Tax=Virgibacillus tibetensis TaxID=3042313 RepID=A0ABU6KHS3_9BACI|nr:aminoimidazole riboside kinase [Virgibacillus sp. C22-A2]
MNQRGVISLGEALIDFIPTDKTNTIYHKSPGGAPANVSVGIAKLGGKSTFLGKVGDDILGRFLEETLKAYDVEVSCMQFMKTERTGIVFVTNADDGERSFDFYINPRADQFLEIQEINEALFVEHKILHFGSISLISNPAKETTHYAVELAKKNSMIVSYDPNLRLALWDSEKHAKDTIISMMEKTDVLKISEEELEFITGETDVEKGVKKLDLYLISLIIVTLGAKGCYVYTKEGSKHVAAMKVNAVDTTGAGDAFVSGILYSLSNYKGNLNSLSLEDAAKMAEFAAVSGALAASKKGAMTALPALAEVKNCLK